MLKGHVFSKQIFGNPIFALFIDTFLNGRSGIINYKNNMEMSYNGSVITVSSGAICIRGRFLEEDTSTDVAAGTDNTFCSLVVEINLDNVNTESEFNQASYKIIKAISSYPALTQTDIVKNNSGVYQYELARFKTNSTGITDFQDTRTYIDLDNLYVEFTRELNKLKDNSNIVLKENIALIEGNVTLNDTSTTGEKYAQTTFSERYPESFNKENCICIAFACKKHTDTDQYGFNYGTAYTGSAEYVVGDFPRRITLNDTEILCAIRNPSTNSFKIHYKIVLMKIR